MSEDQPAGSAHSFGFSTQALARDFPELELRREIGKGSMGIVLEAVRRRDGERVALKVLPPSLTLTARSFARFLREAALIAKVEHPAIVKVHEHGRRGELHFLVMELVDGVTLEQRLEAGPLPVRQAADIGAQIARALQFAHDRGIVHRDLKPSNVLLRREGTVAIADFGLARETASASLTESGTLVGTPMYMAPEQVRGARDAVDTRSDVYGLGALLYHLLTGRPPFVGATADVLRAILERNPPAPRRARRDLPAPLEGIVLKAIEKEPARRYGSAQELAEDLERFLADQRVRARRPGMIARLARRAAQRPLLTSLIAAIVLLSAGAWWLLHDRQQRSLESALHQAEGRLARAAALGDQDAPRSPEQRRALLHEAIALTSAIIAERPAWVAPWVLRAQAHQRLHLYREALHDLDEAAALLGEPSFEIVEARIKTLAEIHDLDARRRLRSELMQLIDLDQGSYTRCLVAEHLLELAGDAPPPKQGELLATVGRVLAGLTDESPRALIARARLVELQGDPQFAAELMRHAGTLFPGSSLVHEHAAQVYRRLGLPDEAATAARMAHMLDPSLEDADAAPKLAPPSGELDVAEFEVFLEKIDDLMRSVRRQP